MNKFKELPILTVIIGILFWFGVYFGLYFLGWPGSVHPCATPPVCFCETVHLGTLAAQKSNTWSDLGFVLAAVFIAYHGTQQYRKKEHAPKPLSINPDDLSYAYNLKLIALYASVILYMGPGSMFFHGAMRQWGGWMDVISMYLFVFFIINYLIYRTWSLKLKTFYAFYFISVIFTICLAIFFHDISSKVFPFFAGTLISLALLQLLPENTLAKVGGTKRALQSRWLVIALSFFSLAVIIWTKSATGKSLCNPDSLLQGHAAWHLLSAAMTIAIHFYLLSEDAPNKANSEH